MNNFEYKIKNRLENYNSEVDPYEIWDGIQAKRNKKKKRRWGFIWIAASIAFLFATVYFLKINHSPNQREIVRDNLDNSGYQTQRVNPNNQFPINSQTQNSRTSTTTKRNIKNIYTDSKTRINNKNDIVKRKNHHSHNFSEITSDTFNPDHTSKIEAEKEQKNIILSKSEEYTNSKIVRRMHSYKSISNTPTRINGLIYNRQELQLKYIPFKKTFVSKRSFNINLYPDISIAANYIYNSFSLSKNKANNFMQNVINNEKQLEAFDVFFGYNIPLYKKFSFYTGLNYGQIDSKLDFTYKDRQDIILDSALTKVVYKSLTDTLRIYERAKTKGTFNIHDIKFNYRRYLRIPVLIAYSSTIKSIIYEIKAGIDFNVLTCNNAKAITPEGKTIALDNTAESLRRKNLLGDFHLDIKLQYRLKKKLILTFGPQYKVGINSLMKESAGFDIYRHSFGLNIGAKFKI